MQAADPDDPFYPYAIAQEYLSAGEQALAQTVFADLLQRFPAYLPSYYHAGLNLYQLGRTEEALACLQAGLALAQAQGERKTANELRELLEDME